MLLHTDRTHELTSQSCQGLSRGRCARVDSMTPASAAEASIRNATSTAPFNDQLTLNQRRAGAERRRILPAQGTSRGLAARAIARLVCTVQRSSTFDQRPQSPTRVLPVSLWRTATVAHVGDTPTKARLAHRPSCAYRPFGCPSPSYLVGVCPSSERDRCCGRLLRSGPRGRVGRRTPHHGLLVGPPRRCGALGLPCEEKLWSYSDLMALRIVS